MTRVARTTPALRGAALAALAMSLAACHSGEGNAAPAGTTFDVGPTVAVLDTHGASMGSVAFPVSCGEDASASMRTGLALLHNMTYSEAERAFARAAEWEPGCAMAYWGQAMTLLHPLWPDVPTPEQLERGWALLQQARDAGLATEREAAYVTALEAYYRDAPDRTEPDRLATYRDAWSGVSAEHPYDPEAALLHALSIVAVAPASTTPRRLQTEAGEIAERVLAAIPDHPGAHHYVIHAYDTPALSDRALPVARSYGAVAPENSHALHMTSHIFTREGLWDESIDYNLRAAEVALAEPIAGRTSHHHLHAVDYLAYAYLQMGDDERALEVLAHLGTLEGPVVDNAASAYAFAAVPARVALEQGDWSRAAALEVRAPATISWDAYPHLEAIPTFARALGAAHVGDLEEARRSATMLEALMVGAEAVPDAYDWATQVRVQELGARAWIALAENRRNEAVSLMTVAAELEATTEKNPVTPAEVLPAGELLGDLLMELGRPLDALGSYAGALERNRNRFHSLHGAARAAEALGRNAIAAQYYRRLIDVAGGSPTRVEVIQRARAFVAEHG